MSHTSTYKYKVKDLQILKEVCEKKGYECNIGKQEVKQFEMGVITADASVKISNWKYPIAIQDDGSLLYDAWGSSAGAMDRLGKLLQDYNEEVILRGAFYTHNIHPYIETLSDGSKKIVLEF